MRGAAPQTFLVHRLVLSAFVGPCPAGMEGCHNNGTRTDNRLANLRWDTRVGNVADRRTHGTLCRGDTHGRSKLTEASVLAMRADREAGMSYPELMRKYGLSKPAVSHIINRRTWGHV